VIDNHQRRRSQLQKLVDEGKARLDDHESGRKLMETEEFEKISKRIRLYEQKLSRMAEQPDERVSNCGLPFLIVMMISSLVAQLHLNSFPSNFLLGNHSDLGARTTANGTP
jgi:hypothetical protein